MSLYKIYQQSPFKTTRTKTEYLRTEEHSKVSQFTVSSTAREPYEQDSYMEIAISRNRISQRRKRQQSQHSESHSKEQKKKIFLFKNLQQFQRQLKTQRGKLDKIQAFLNAFGIATYRGVKKSINSHQIGAHIGELTALTLIEGYDGYFAASELKKYYNNELLLSFKSHRNIERQQPFHAIEALIKKAIDNSKKHLNKTQKERGDNSGASFVSLIAYKGLIFVANCGESQVFCFTKQGRMLKLAKAHNTKNESQVDRIVKEGGQLYQTIVNFPYHKEMKVQGPLRVYPDGLSVTRTLGKSLSASKQKKYSTVSDTIAQQKGILSVPEFQYIPSSEVRWVVILGSKIVQKVKALKIKEIIQQELSKRSTNYSESQAAEHSCKRVILQAVEMGAADSLSALLVLGNVAYSASQRYQKQVNQPKICITPAKTGQSLHRQPRSFKYIGNRSNFVQIQDQE